MLDRVRGGSANNFALQNPPIHVEDYSMTLAPFLASLLLLLISLASPASATDWPPVPQPKPVRLQATAEKSVPFIPIPRIRPDDEARKAPAPVATPAPDVPQQRGWPAEVVAAGRAECGKLLAGLPLTYTPLDPIGDQGGCGAPAPILITAVAGVALMPPATQTCDMGQALARWIDHSVKPAARDLLQTEITVIHTATSYYCRRRNNSATGKMSEHSKANGLDLSGFSFARQTKVAVDGNWGQGLGDAAGQPGGGGNFLDTIRKSACTHFTTVLGPGSDPYHGDHFHIDVLRRKNDYRICQ
jgi:hypothetical protein